MKMSSTRSCRSSSAGYRLCFLQHMLIMLCMHPCATQCEYDWILLQVAELGSSAGPSVQAAPELLSYLGSCLVQDAAAGLAERYPHHDMHKRLLADPRFRWVMISSDMRQQTAH